MGVDFVEGVAVLVEVGDEVGSDGEGDETGAEGGLGGSLGGGVAAVGDGGFIVFKTTPPMGESGRRGREGTLNGVGAGMRHTRSRNGRGRPCGARFKFAP